LIEVAEGVDGAIFLFTGDDQTWYRGDMTTTARDNVTLEYGIFVRKLGRQRTLILKQNEVRVPSDIHAISYGEVISDDKTVGELDVRTFVSFGPGDARTDLELTTSLAKTEPWLQYIPVDICIGLLQHAINVINKDIPVPVGILGDFEDGLGFIKAQLHNYAPE